MSLKQKITTDKAPVMMPGMFFDRIKSATKPNRNKRIH